MNLYNLLPLKELLPILPIVNSLTLKTMSVKQSSPLAITAQANNGTPPPMNYNITDTDNNYNDNNNNRKFSNQQQDNRPL